jgi:hypothetical protein
MSVIHTATQRSSSIVLSKRKEERGSLAQTPERETVVKEDAS